MIHQQVEFLIKRDYLKEWLGEIIHWHTIIVSSVISLVSPPFHPSFTYAYRIIYLPLIHVKSDLFSIHNEIPRLVIEKDEILYARSGHGTFCTVSNVFLILGSIIV